VSALEGVKCDGCGRSSVRDASAYSTPSANRVRETLKTLGWHKTKGTWTGEATGRVYGYTRDVCPSCWAEGVR